MRIPNFSLAGEVAIITGGKRGIGRAIALAFAEAGADVAVCSRVVEDGELEHFQYRTDSCKDHSKCPFSALT